MKKAKQTLILLVTLTTVLFISCSKNDENINGQDTESIDYLIVNNDLENYSYSFNEVFDSEENIINSLEKHLRIKNNDFAKSNDIKYSEATEEIESHIEISQLEEKNFEVATFLPSHYDNSTELFLLEYYNELSNAYDYEVPKIIKKYQSKLNFTLLSLESKKEIQLIVDASSMAVGVLDEVYKQEKVFGKNTSSKGFWSCMGKTGGKKIGRGMVGGILRGGYLGLGGGPAGVVIGAAKGAVIGALLGAVWAAADCLPAMQQMVAQPERLLLEETDFIEGKSLILSEKTLLSNLNTFDNIIIKKSN